jgi:predicted Rossmann fold flavoprotein
LKLSAWGALDLAALKYDFKISVNWIPEYNEQTALDVLRVVRFEKASQKMNGKNPFDLPTRLWEYLLAQSGVQSELRWADLPAKEQNLLAKTLCNQEFHIQGKTTFKEEFVTAGGVKLDQINPATMESKLVNGLFFAGEVLNIDGVTGGFNFQNAWTTGWLAAKAISEKDKQQEASSPSN